MKTRTSIYTLLTAGLLSLSSCVGDLDVLPLDETIVTTENAYSTPASYTQALHKIYSAWALSGQDDASNSDIQDMDAGKTVLIRALWTLQEQPTDEMKSSSSETFDPELNKITWSTTKLDPIEGVYQRCMYIVALTNEFLKNIPNAPTEIDRKSYEAQARLNRALAYYILMDTFGRPPFITEANYSLEPTQLSRADLFKWIEEEINLIKNDLPAARSQYGLADQGTANALLARMYLNAEVYTGTARWNDCVTACEEVIKGGYELANTYRDLFRADNGENTDTNREIIFPVMFDGNETQSWAMAALVVGSREAPESPQEGVRTSGVESGWNTYRGTGQLVELFDFADNNNRKASEILDKRGIFIDTNRSIHITSDPQKTFTTEGWAVYKFSNLNHDNTPGKNTLWCDTDFPMFRLGDVYLMYAEATARGASNGNIQTAISRIKALRERGYGAGNDPETINEAWMKADNYRNILDERGRELYWEGVRRTDLIRFNLFTSSQYVWDFKGGVANGTEVNKRYNLYPIPVSDITVNTKLEQNEGYK